MGVRTDGAENVAAIELSGRKKIERGGEEADPRGAADGVDKQMAGGKAGMKNGSEEMQNERAAEDDGGGRVNVGDDFGMHHAVDQRGNSEDEADERAAGTDVEQRAIGTNGRAHQDERAEGANERREGNEERVAGVNVVMAAGEKMAKFVREKDGKQCEREGKSGKKRSGMFIKKCVRVKQFVNGAGAALREGDGELRACGESGA